MSRSSIIRSRASLVLPPHCPGPVWRPEIVEVCLAAKALPGAVSFSSNNPRPGLFASGYFFRCPFVGATPVEVIVTAPPLRFVKR